MPRKKRTNRQHVAPLTEEQIAEVDAEGLPALHDEPPEPPEDLKPAFAALDASRSSDRTKRAMRWAAAGYTWPEVAQIIGAEDCRWLRRIAKRYGIHRALAKSDRIITQDRLIAYRSGQLLLQRLEEDPDSFSPKELAVVRGISVDKLAMFEGWKGGRGSDDGSFVAELRRAAVEGTAVKLSIEVEPNPHLEDREVRDITSEASEER